ncbi:DUF3093 family protein [Cellulomonas sp. JH27-2]|uniref:DUF3093 family protein n=1 Tax=Cellulomonas sp. JH27-2 TaxID=2774139 RepID=UPI00177C92C8|nr:DUF3093 family protein [Cellulomonas sp. JH27-2]
MIRYQERSPSRRSWLVLLTICVVAWVGLALKSWVLATILVGMLGGIAAITMWSTGFYGNIRLTDSDLRVGRARIKLADLYPWGVSQPGEKIEGRIIGGAYGSTLGSHVIGLSPRQGAPMLVQTKDPDALRAALEKALAPYRDAS